MEKDFSEQLQSPPHALKTLGQISRMSLRHHSLPHEKLAPNQKLHTLIYSSTRVFTSTNVAAAQIAL